MNLHALGKTLATIIWIGSAGVLLFLSWIIWHTSSTLIAWLTAIVALSVFVHDFRRFGLGLASFSELFILLPLLSVTVFIGDTLALPREQDHNMIRSHLHQVTSLLTLALAIWTLMVNVFGRSISSLDSHLVQSIRNPKWPTLFSTIFGLAAIIAAFIFQPQLPFQEYGSRVQNALPGRGWGYISLIFLFIVLISKRTKIGIFSIIFVPFWYITHNARVDILGLLVVFLMLIRWGPSINRLSILHRTGIVSLGVMAAWFMAYMGSVRAQGFRWDPQLFWHAPRDAVNYGTTKNIVFSFAAGIEHYKEFGAVSTLEAYLVRMVPGALSSGPTVSAEVLQELGTGGGVHFLGEFYLNGGPFLAIAAPAIFFFWLFGLPILLVRINSLGSEIKAFSAYVPIITMGRVMWYDGQLVNKVLFYGMLILLSILFVNHTYHLKTKSNFQNHGLTKEV